MNHACFIDGVKFPEPISKIVCVGRNYAEHAKELSNPIPASPLLFIKPNSSVVPLVDRLTIPTDAGEVHFETELAVLVGTTLCKATQRQIPAAIAGLGIALDLTQRDLQTNLKKLGHPWEKSKAFDGSCPLSAFVRFEEQRLDRLEFQLTVNGNLRQQGDTGNMLVSVSELLIEISNYFTLIPGDVVLTGTPEGVGALRVGDKLEISGLAEINTNCIVESAG